MSIFKAGTALKNIESLAGHFASILEHYTEEFLANGNIESGVISYLISILQTHQTTLLPPVPVSTIVTPPQPPEVSTQ